MSVCKGHIGRPRQSAGKGQDGGYMLFLRSMGEVLGILELSPDGSIQKQNSKVLISTA